MNSLNRSIHHQCPQTKDENAFKPWPFVETDPIDPSALRSASSLVGSDLTTSDYAELESRWIDRSLAVFAGLRRVDSLAGGEIIGRKNGNYSGILIPYFRPGSDHVREYRLRRDQPDLEYDSAGNLKPRQKYLSPPGRSNMLYIVPGVSQELLRDELLPVLITEGEFKTLALWRLANHGSRAQPRFLPLGISGVYNWRGTIGKTVGPDGSRLDVKGAIPDLDWIAWEGRRVIIAYDADVVAKDHVRIARSELAAHLRGRGGLVAFLEWDVTRGKGIDDHLAAVGPETVLDEIAHVDFAGSAWRKDLLRSKPPMNNTEGRILPVLANAIAAFRHAPEWGGVLAFNEFGLGTVALKPTPWGIVPKGEWTDHEDRLAAEWLQKQGTSDFSRPVQLCLRARLRSPELVKDAYQETFLRVLAYFRSGKTLANPASLPGFVHAICRNSALELLRRNTRHDQLPDDAPEPVDTALNPSPDTTGIDCQTPLAHHFRHMQVGNGVTQIPTDTMRDHIAGIMAPFEWLRRGDRHRSRVSNRRRSIFGNGTDWSAQSGAHAVSNEGRYGSY